MAKNLQKMQGCVGDLSDKSNICEIDLNINRTSLIYPIQNSPSGDEESELSALAGLFEAMSQVQMDRRHNSWKPCIKTDEGFRACKQFLCALSTAADTLGIRPQSRAYRSQFTKNYRALFPDHRRQYRVDVLEAAQEGYTMIYVNGERFDFHPAVLESGSNLRLAWAHAMEKLHRLHRENFLESPFWRSELVPTFVNLDSKWADFEEEYILELILIERKARRYVLDVIFLENQLMYLDGAVAALVAECNSAETAHLHIWKQWQQCRRDYISKVFRLNSVANYKRKGKCDLDLSVLEASENVIRTNEAFPGHAIGAVTRIAAACVASFNSFRRQINELAQTPERIDPHLCNNASLVSHLVRLEDTWELSQKFVAKTEHMLTLLKLVSFILQVAVTHKNFCKFTPSKLETGEYTKCNIDHLNGNDYNLLSNCNTNNSTVSIKRTGNLSPVRDSDGIVSSQQHEHMFTEDLGGANKTIKSVSAQVADGNHNAVGSLSNCFVSAQINDSTGSRRHSSLSTSSTDKEPFEEKLLACDVEAILALPRLVCLFYLMDPVQNIVVFRRFLPEFCKQFSPSEDENIRVDTKPSVERVHGSCSTTDIKHINTSGPIKESLGWRKSNGNSQNIFSAIPEGSFSCKSVASSTSQQSLPCQNTANKNQYNPNESFEVNDHSINPNPSANAFPDKLSSMICFNTRKPPYPPSMTSKSCDGVAVKHGGKKSCSCVCKCNEQNVTQSPNDNNVDKNLTLSSCADNAELKDFFNWKGSIYHSLPSKFRCASCSKKKGNCKSMGNSSKYMGIGNSCECQMNGRRCVSEDDHMMVPSGEIQQDDIKEASNQVSLSEVGSIENSGLASNTQGDFKQCDFFKAENLKTHIEGDASTVCGSSLNDSRDSSAVRASDFYGNMSEEASNGNELSISMSSEDLEWLPVGNTSEHTGQSRHYKHSINGTEHINKDITSEMNDSSFISNVDSANMMHSNGSGKHIANTDMLNYMSDKSNVCFHGVVCGCGKKENSESNSCILCPEAQVTHQFLHMDLSTAPKQLKRLLKSWVNAQIWFKEAGIEDQAEPWLLIVSRMVGDDDIPSLMQKCSDKRLVGFSSTLEALFHSTEEVSMSLQRACPQEWNELLQAIVQGIQYRKTSASK